MLITGQQFNDQYGCEWFVKLTNETCIHNGLEFKEGLNKDTIEFNSERSCGPGGLYFCKYEHFGRWTYYNKTKMEYMWDVKIPNDAEVVIMDNKIKCNMFILLNKRCIWTDHDLCLKAIKYNQRNIQFIKVRSTDAMWFEMCRYSGFIK